MCSGIQVLLCRINGQGIYVAMAQAIERDSTTQERLARESYGMIRDGEFLYRLVP